MDIDQFLSVLALEIKHVADDFIASIAGRLSLEVRGSSTRLVRLARRAAVWTSLSNRCTGHTAVHGTPTLVTGVADALASLQLRSHLIMKIIKNLKLGLP